MQRPVGIAQQLAGQQDQVGLAGAQHVFGLHRFGDQPHGASGDARFAADALGELGLVAGADGNFRVRRGAAGGHIDQVHAQRLEPAGQLHRLVRVPAIVHPVGGRQAHQQRQFRGPDPTHRLAHLQQQADAILEGAAIVILTAIGEWREELVQQVAVRSMHFGDLEAGGPRPLGAFNEGTHHLGDAGLVQLGGHRMLGIEGQRRRADRHPAALVQRHAAALAAPGLPGAGLAPGMGQLDAGQRALGRNERGDTPQRLDVRIAPDAQVMGTDAPLGQHRRGFEDHQAGAADGPAAQMHQVPVGGQAILGGRVLAHGRHHDPVGQGQLTQGQGLEQQRHDESPERFPTSKDLLRQPEAGDPL